MGEIFKGVTLPKGFQAAGGSAGIKKDHSDDIAMIYSTAPCVTAGTFTTNQVKAAPVLFDRALVHGSGISRAVLINSGIANACTGKEGMDCCRAEAEAVGKCVGIPADSVLVASTGVIGQQIPVDKIKNGVQMLAPELADTEEAAHRAARAIMTTDTKPKEVGCVVRIGGKDVSIGGMCKGSGMIHPNMCTMLAFLTTDAAVSHEMLQAALSEVVPDTFNMVSVDGDTSTNDTVLLMANGLAGNPEIAEKNGDYETLKAALLDMCTQLARKIAGDGEGATALFEVTVKGAKDVSSAKILAKSVVTSNLTKTAICGHDANWGRILCALGYSGVPFDPEKVDLYFKSAAGTIQIAKNGTSTGYSEETATKILSLPEVTAIADMHMGDAEATAWGCDLTHEYVTINADYRS
ncbi:MAG: bifunctional glutamate N-acetyltransferase/amino-acid acetyltransferase ArgJ [Lachnospiraceae bacterium]|jgi:glutamate N-acetyltransferase/amino-acid N-acetyltransferase|nr:bifunctional glutamate N-acetyltransferase/amino-acid acetyltransferase ArgJ [Lachnospiraceae bacterium]MCI1329265.1 bifunctional glutamate N-acetyltransferase/amino-acid acetyltransferase ArgJ [Lachnospiraceae bacterium]